MAVTGFAAALGISAGLTIGRVLLLASAILAGQLSVGWSNDYIDRDRDRATGRTAKPITAEALSARLVGTAALAALGACVPLSLALGVLPGVLHLAAVGSAWSYNLGLKATVTSPLPYLVSFGLLPGIVATALPDTPAPRPAVLVAGGLLGVAAHFANTVGDVKADAVTGVRGLPQRLGPRRSVVLSAGVVALSALVLLTFVPDGRRPAPIVLLGAGVACAAGCIALTGRARTSDVFRLNVAAAGLIVAGFLASGGALALGG